MVVPADQYGVPLVTFSHEGEITLPLPCPIEWVHPSFGAAGQVSLSIPHGSPAASSDYIDPEGGSLLQIMGTSGAGRWRGIIYDLSYDEEGVNLTAAQEHILLGYTASPAQRRLAGISASTLAYQVCTGAGFPIKGWADHGPILTAYELAGQSNWSILDDLMRLSGGEIFIDEEGLVSWAGPRGTLYPEPLMAPGELHEWAYSVNILDQVSRVTAASSSTVIVRDNPGAAASRNWPAHVVLRQQVDHPSDLIILAESELGRRSQPLIGISASVGRDHWSIREGDYLNVILPKAKFGGVNATTRVLSRAIQETGDLMRLRLVFVDTGVSQALLSREQDLPTVVRRLTRQLEQMD